jgi:hypothetical protein
LHSKFKLIFLQLLFTLKNSFSWASMASIRYAIHRLIQTYFFTIQWGLWFVIKRRREKYPVFMARFDFVSLRARFQLTLFFRVKQLRAFDVELEDWSRGISVNSRSGVDQAVSSEEFSLLWVAWNVFLKTCIWALLTLFEDWNESYLLLLRIFCCDR